MSRSKLYVEADMAAVETTSLVHRPSKLHTATTALVTPRMPAATQVVRGLPESLGAEDLRRAIAWWTQAAHSRVGVVLMLGGHVIKVGLGPLVCELLREGFVDHLVLNGAAAIHDVELACFGHTSEDVASQLPLGKFGTWEETGVFFAHAAHESCRGKGLGEALAEHTHARMVFADGYRRSVLAAAYQYDVPVTVHAAIGTDIVHQHPLMDGAALGEATARDFRRLAGYLPAIHKGGLVLNWGSAVILPEVFVKALNVARNLNEGVPHSFNAVNCDMQRQYRPEQNVLIRPTSNGGQWVNLTGQHEILLPLLGWSVLEARV